MRIGKVIALVPLHLLTLTVLVDSKCSVREPPGVTSSAQPGDAGFQLSINEQPEFYEERNLYTITLKVMYLSIQRFYVKYTFRYVILIKMKRRILIFNIIAERRLTNNPIVYKRLKI